MNSVLAMFMWMSAWSDNDDDAENAIVMAKVLVK